MASAADLVTVPAVREEAVGFMCAGETLVGVLARPVAGQAPAAIGVVIVVGGPQYRVGSHRQFVLLARHLAAAGHAVLRFDVRGMGDSEGGAQQSFEHLSDDIAASIGALMQAEPAVSRVVLWGLCDGASASLLYCGDTQDPRVAGLCLLNPWVRTEAGLARAHVKHYYRQRLREPAFWRKLLRGSVGFKALGDLGRNLRRMSRGDSSGAKTSFQQRMARAWTAFDGSVLLLLSEHDMTAREFMERAESANNLDGWAPRAGVVRHVITQADHTLSTRQARRTVEDLVQEWLRGLS